MKEYKNLMKYGLLATGVVITTIEIIRVLKKKKEENNAIGDKENVADKIIDVLKTEDEKNEPVKYYSSGKRSSYDDDDEDDDTHSRSSQYQDGDDYSKGVQDAIWGLDPTEPLNSDYMSGYDTWA